MHTLFFFTLLIFCLLFPKDEANPNVLLPGPLLKAVLQLWNQESYLTLQPIHYLHV